VSGVIAKEMALLPITYAGHALKKLQDKKYVIPAPDFLDHKNHLELSQFGSIAPMTLSTIQTIGTAIHNPFLEQSALWSDGVVTAFSEYSHVMQSSQFDKTAKNIKNASFETTGAIDFAPLNQALREKATPEEIKKWVNGYQLDGKLMKLGSFLAALGGLLWFMDFGRGAFILGRSGLHARYQYGLDTNGDFKTWQKKHLGKSYL
jgi:hypothetical protein